MTVFIEFSHQTIENGCSTIRSKLQTVANIPLSKHGAINNPNHTTGIINTQ